MTQVTDKKQLPPIKLAAHRVWVAERKKTLPDGVTLAYLLVTTPSGGASYHPVARLPRELAAALPEHDARLFVERPVAGDKPQYEEITLVGNTFDWEAGTVALPVTLEPNPQDTFPGKRKGKGGLVPITAGGSDPGAAVPEEVEEPTEESEPEVTAADEEAPPESPPEPTPEPTPEPAPEPTPDPEPAQEAPETPQEAPETPEPASEPSEPQIEPQGATEAVPEAVPEAAPKDELPIPKVEIVIPETAPATTELQAAVPEATPPATPEAPRTLFKQVKTGSRTKYVPLAPGEKHKGELFEKVGNGKATRYVPAKKGK